jgi:hypothetical protein
LLITTVSSYLDLTASEGFDLREGAKVSGHSVREWHHRPMLAALNVGAVVLGVASGALSASVVALLLGTGLSLTGTDWGADVGLVLGVLFGMALGGWVAGLKARHSGRFHGAVTGVVLAFIVMVIARFGGSPAGTGTILWLALLSVFVSGLAGWLAFRRKTRPN